MKTIKIIRIGQIVILPLLLMGLLLGRLGQPHNTVCAEAAWRPAHQTISNTVSSAVSSDTVSNTVVQFIPPALSQTDGFNAPIIYPPDQLPAQFDWRNHFTIDFHGNQTDDPDIALKPEDQGSCNSCYAFSTVGAVEAYLTLRGVAPDELDISEDNAKNCNPYTEAIKDGDGCNNGNVASVLNWLNIKGTVLKSEDPYVATEEACKTDVDYLHTILGWLEIGTKKDFTAREDLKNYLINYGSLAVSVRLSNTTFNDYKEGDPPIRSILETPESPPTIDHFILLVGWDDDVLHEQEEGKPQGNSQRKGAWIIKNSWGSDWGDNGFAKVAYDSVNLEYGKSYVPTQHEKYDPDGALLYHDTYGAGNQTVVGTVAKQAMVKITPKEDSCATRVEFQHNQLADITISNYTISIYDDQDEETHAPRNPLFKNLQAHAPAGGNISIELEEALPLFKDNEVYIVIKLDHASKLMIDNSSKVSSINYYMKEGDPTWKSFKSAFNIRLRTTKCDADMLMDPTPTPTLFKPTPTETPQPTPTTTAVSSQLSSPSPTPAVPVAEVCTLPAIQDRVVEASQFQPPMALSPQPKRLAPKRFLPSKPAMPKRQLVSSTQDNGALSELDMPAEPISVTQKYFSGLEIPAVPPNISGTVLLPDGTPAPHALISLYPLDSDGKPYGKSSSMNYTDQHGQFKLALMETDYLAWIDPPLTTLDNLPIDGVQSLLHTFIISDIVTSDDPIVDLGMLTLLTTTKVIQGRVIYTTSGPIISGAPVITRTEIEAFNLDTGQWLYTHPAEDGTFTLHVGGGPWELSLWPKPDEDWISLDPVQRVTFRADTSDENNSHVEFILTEPDALLTGQIQRPSGDALTSERGNKFDFNEYASFDIYSVDSEYFASGHLDASGQFTIPLPAGRYEGFVWLHDRIYPQHMGPIQEGIISVISGTVDLGEITVLANSAIISGHVLDSDGGPAPYTFVDVWQDGGLWLYGSTDSFGRYEIEVPAGKWWVQPDPMAHQAHLFTGQVQPITVTANSTQQMDFSLEPSAGSLFGALIDDEDNLLANVDAIAHIRRGEESTPVSYSFVDNGRFELKMPYGESLAVGLHIEPNSPYFLSQEFTRTSAGPSDSLAANAALSLSGREQVTFTQEIDSDRPVTLKLIRANAQVIGMLVHEDDKPIENISGSVFAIDQANSHNWKRGEIHTDGSYVLDLIEGKWDLFYELEGDIWPLVPTSEHYSIQVDQGATITQNLLAREWNSFIDGIVLDERGAPVPNHPVWMRVNGNERHTETDQRGQFTLYATQAISTTSDGKMPQMQALIGAHPSQQLDLIDGAHFQASAISQVTLHPIQNRDIQTSSVTLTVRQPNGYLTGQVLDSDNGNRPVENAQVSGISRDGQSFTVMTDSQGCFAAPIQAGDNVQWKLAAEYSNITRSTASMEIVPQATDKVNADADPEQPFALSTGSVLLLEYRETMPQPETHIFSVQEGWVHTMSDGFTVEIQPNAIDTHNPRNGDQQVKIELRPLAEVHDTYLHTTVGYGYEISLSDTSGRPLRSEFKRDVRLILPYIEGRASSEDDLAIGVLAHDQWKVDHQTIPLRDMKDVDQENETPHGYKILIEKPGIYALLEPNKIEQDVMVTKKLAVRGQRQWKEISLPFISQ